MVMNVPAWEEPLGIRWARELIGRGGELPGVALRVTQACRIRPPDYRGRGLLHDGLPSSPQAEDAAWRRSA
jgi:hypothetical protein